MLLLLPKDVQDAVHAGCIRRMGPAPPPQLGDLHKLLFGVEEGEYPKLIELLVERGLVELVSTAGEAIQGVFGVPKGELARLILNATAANELCETPWDPRLSFI